MKRAVKGILVFISILIIAVIMVIRLITLKSGYSLESPSLKALDKILVAESKGGTAAFTEKEVNSLLAAIYNNPEEMGGITLKTPQFKFNDEKLIMGIPAIYNGRDFIIWTAGELGYDEENIIYDIESFKIGKLTIPKAMVFDRLKSYNVEGITIKDEDIYINKDIIPIDVTSAVLNDNILTLKMEKFDLAKLFKNKEIKGQLEALKNKLNDLREKALNSEEKKQIDELLNRLKEGIKNPSQNILNEISNGLKDISKNIKSNEGKEQAQDIANSIDKTIKDNEKNNKPQEGNKGSEAGQTEEEKQELEEEKRNLLVKARNQLSGSANNAGSEGGNRAISIMVSTLNNMINNPSYDYVSDAAVVKGIYNGLSSSEKNALMGAIMTNADTFTLIQLADIFNLR